LEAWARVLREGCSLSVLNHATLPVKERKTQHSAKKCAKYDVVLTTFDAMKSPDVTIGVDDNGYALTKRASAEGGWHSSRNSSQSAAVQQCKQLSVLHLVDWRRIIFADILGQKCFLAKPETARVEAARSLNAESRYVFCILPCCPKHKTNHHLLITRPFIARSPFKLDVQVHILLRVCREGLRTESFNKE
jgi:hypothetical protein